jgi:predicted nucleotidyltransferase
MSLSNIHFDLKELLKKAIENKEYDKVMKLMNKLLNENNTPFDPNEINGIKFSDVKEIVKSKEELENILLSTKVIFESKDELLQFFEMLLKYGYKESAISYFEELILNMNDYDIIEGFNSLLR